MMLAFPLAHVDAIDRATLNICLEGWGHRMGAYTRPRFAFKAHHALFEHGEPVAVAAAGETAREVVGETGLKRSEVIELVRLCAARPGLCRPMLRLWREMVLPALAAVHGRAIAVSYQDEALHTGDLYRWDGWLLLGRAGGGGTDARTGRQGRKMKLWGWSADAAAHARLAEIAHAAREAEKARVAA